MFQTKPCIKCQAVNRTSSGACRSCKNANQEKRRKANPEKFLVASRKSAAKQRKTHPEKCREANKRCWKKNGKLYAETQRDQRLQRKYGITSDKYEELLNFQEHKCAICPTPVNNSKRFAVDHCHTTGKVRGLLCSPCNLMLGNAFDNPEILNKAATYLKKAN